MPEDSKSALTKLLDRSALFLAAFGIVLRLAVSSGAAEWGDNLFIHAILWAAAAVWFGARALEGRWIVRWTATEIPLAVFLLLSLLSIPRASFRLAAIEGAAAFGTLVLLAILAGSLFADRRGALIALLNASLFAVALYAVLQRFWILGVLEREHGSGMAPEMLIRVQSRQVWSTFLYPNSLGGFLAILLPVAAGSMLDGRERRDRILYGATAGLGALALAFSASRGAALALAAGSLVFIMRLSRRRRVVVACLIAVAASGFFLGPRLWQVHTMQIRAAYWRAAVRIASDHPVLGVGLNNFSEHYYQYRDATQQEVVKAHNDYLQILAELGIPGLLAWLAFLGLTVRGSFKPRELSVDPDKPPRAVLAAAIGTAILAAVLLRGTFNDVPGQGLLIIGLMLAGWITPFLASRSTLGPHTHTGLLAGFAAGCVHSLVDYDLYEYGVAATFVLTAGLLPVRRTIQLGRRAAFTALGATASIALLMLVWAPRFMESDALHREASDSKDVDEAVRLLTLAAQANPLDPEPHALLAEAWFAQRPRAEMAARACEASIAAIDRAIALRPRHAPYHDRKAWMEEEMGLAFPSTARDHFARARESFQRSLELYPTRAGSHYSFARLLDRMDQPDEALHHYRHALEFEKLADTDRLRLKPYERIRALARAGPLEALVEALRTQRAIDTLPTAMGGEYDERIKTALDRAIAELRRSPPR